jgi:hypothetical protein
LFSANVFEKRTNEVHFSGDASLGPRRSVGNYGRKTHQPEQNSEGFDDGRWVALATSGF